MSELVSVVIPTFNRADILAKAVDSARQQTYQNLEIIVVSDGSTDQTDQVVQQLQQEDRRIRYLSYSPGKGGNFARNHGARHAKGEIIAFLDDDDTWHEQKIDKQLSTLGKDEKVGLVYTGALAIYEEENTSYTITPKYRGDLSREIFKANLIGITSTVLLRKRVFEEAGFFDEMLPARQDYDMWIRVCQLCLVDYVQEALVDYYNRKGQGQVSRNFDRYKKATEMIIRKYSHLFDGEGEKKNFEFSMYMMAAKHAMRVGETVNARSFLQKALKLQRTKDAILRFAATYLFNRKLLLFLRKLKR